MSESESPSGTGEPTEEEPLPKLPRAPLFGKLSTSALIRIAMFATMLYAVIAMRGPCSAGVGRFIGGFDDPPDAGPPVLTDHYPGYELLTAEEALERWPDQPAEDAGSGDSGSGTRDETEPPPTPDPADPARNDNDPAQERSR